MTESLPELCDRALVEIRTWICKLLPTKLSGPVNKTYKILFYVKFACVLQCIFLEIEDGTDTTKTAYYNIKQNYVDRPLTNLVNTCKALRRENMVTI